MRPIRPYYFVGLSTEQAVAEVAGYLARHGRPVLLKKLWQRAFSAYGRPHPRIQIGPSSYVQVIEDGHGPRAQLYLAT